MERQQERAGSIQYDHSFMIVVTGDSGVGKSALLRKFGQPDESWEKMKEIQATIGVDYVRRPLRVLEREILLQSWDTAGQERFRTITTSYYRSAMGAIICYDCTNEQSFKHLTRWIKDFRDKAREGAPILIVATKADLDPQDPVKEGMSRRGTVDGEARLVKKLILPIAPASAAEQETQHETQEVQIDIQSRKQTECDTMVTFEEVIGGDLMGGAIIEGCEEELKQEMFASCKSTDPHAFPPQVFTLIQQGKELAAAEGCGFIRTSALTGFNIERAFKEVCRLILVAQGQVGGEQMDTSLTQHRSMSIDSNGLNKSVKLRAMATRKQESESKKKRSACCGKQ